MAEPGVTRISILGTESIVIGCGILKDSGSICHEACKAARYVVITDENVGPLYLDRVLDSFERATGLRPIHKTLAPGESAKCRGVKAELEDWMLEQRCGRDACMVALGGGVIGDLTGYVAATYMRGIKVVQIPTTLLAMVDSSVGGKTGIDTPTGKNLVGAFHHPQRILMDLEVLQSLPMRQLCNGMAEVVKTALLWDADRFTELEQHADEILAKDPKWLQSIVEGSAGIKAEVVTEDEKEGGLRTLLNVGHSIGHAVEAFLQPEMLHGEAVSIGTVREAMLSRRLGHITEAEVGRIIRCLQSFRLPVVLPTTLSLDGLMAKMAIDKKNKGGKKYVALLERIGKCVNNRAIAVDDADIMASLAHSVEIVPMPATPGGRSVELTVPGSKSLSNRALLIAALGKGTCRVKGLLHSDDTQVMLEALQLMKACTFEWADKGNTLVVHGNGGRLTAPEAGQEIYLGNAGTASRFLTSAALLAKAPITLTGNKRMKERPIASLVTALSLQEGVSFRYLKSEGCLPLSIDGGSKGFNGGGVKLSADVSSQYVSSVLISAPYAAGQVELELTGGKVVSQPYIDMTVSIMRDFGISVSRQEGTDTYTIPTGAYANPSEYQVEVDASSATYPLAIPAVLSGVAAGAASGGPFSITVNGIGSASVQGDAHFAELLEKMGCSITVEKSRTTVRQAGGRLKAVDIDMNTMTDAFMTAAVVMALADGTSRITGIANQRVKECNRIEAMITEFAKIGVQCNELPDGLEIVGTTPDKLRPADIFCYKDHRIAMSFAILGLAVPGVTILDTACVEKTYPVFWDHLTQIIGADIIPKDVKAGSAATGGSTGLNQSSILLVGIRGAGKTTLGRHAAQYYGWKFLDLDDVFEEEVQPIKSFIDEFGWGEFRKKEAEILESTMKKHAKKCVIASGGGLVESPEARRALNGLKAGHKVIFVNKGLRHIEEELKASGKPAWGEPVDVVYNRRFPYFRQCSTHELVVDPQGGWGRVSREFIRLVDHILFARDMRSPAAVRNLKSFLSLTFDDVSKIVPFLPQVEGGADALELRADLLADFNLESVTEQVALLRRSSDLPVIFTVRSVTQGGKYPDDNQVGAVELLKQAGRLGCEFVDVEMTLRQELREELLEAISPSLVVMSHHDPARLLSWDALERKIVEASRSGADIVKIVTTASEVDDCSRLRAAVKRANIEQPVIALAMGGLGKLSRALNDVMTPITHPCMPVAAAPGQLSMSSINSLRKLLGILPDSKSFFLFGTPVSQSRGPLTHNTGFDSLGLAPGWKYSTYETDSIDEIKAVVSGSDFGGASVTIPMKEKVHIFCGKLSDAARQIGAVNTLHRNPETGEIEGDNTDWAAMKIVAEKRLQVLPKVGLCIGAGGSARAACYAIKKLGVTRLLIWNRTLERAEVLAKEFGGEAVTAEQLGSIVPDVVVSNIPGPTQADSLPAFSFAPTSVIVEMAYTPRETLLLKRAAEAGSICVEGMEVFLEQAFLQFKLWTGINPPREVIRKEVYNTL
eukprot:TRINITY_DN9073_c0_g3_i2.p1 TRINITY_DN9073_c0_g3~~TRINITY_DN9073_c0_g3_i2.p1  ORF type:complete len:1550 (+),score=597.62 TRINITY_DN9073_c0_g3_i2:119-4651(+)